MRKYKDLKEIGEILQGEVSPAELTDILQWLSGLYGVIAWDMSQVESKKPFEWTELRKRCQSANETDKLWETTELGQLEIKHKWELRILDKMSSAIKARLRRLTEEAHNQF